MPPTIAETRMFIKRAHAGQTDKAGKPYYQHPLAVELRVQVIEGAGEADRIVALLHDTLEDTKVTPEDLEEMGYPLHVIDAVKLLTKPEGITYDGFIDKLIASGNNLAMRVKLADLLENSDPARLALLPEPMASELKSKYRIPKARLFRALNLKET